tara:strand:- start:84 stop:323 length:240 start_codon:yes stop_codon:yes gene_type:complete
MHKIHGPNIIGSYSFLSVITQLGFHTPLWRLVTQLKSHLIVNATGSLDIHMPTLALKHKMNAPIPISHPRLANLLNALF